MTSVMATSGRGMGSRAWGRGDYVDVRYISPPTAETRNTIASVPVNNIVDNLSWTKGKHNLEFGVNWRLIHQNRTSDLNSYNSASTNPQWLGTTAASQPDLIGLNPVDGNFTNAYSIAYASLVGTVPYVTNQYNYQVTSPAGGALLADGAPISRHFSANEFEGFVQDQWQLSPTLTVTAGLRYTVLQTPWETHGQEVTPTIDTDKWFKAREASALQSVVNEPDLSFAPAGKYLPGKPGFYPKNKDNFAPRVAIAWAPNAETSVRTGFGIYFDHFGEALVVIFDRSESLDCPRR